MLLLVGEKRKPQEKPEERTGDIVNVELGLNLYKSGVDIDLIRIGADEVIDINNHPVTDMLLQTQNERIEREFRRS